MPGLRRVPARRNRNPRAPVAPAHRNARKGKIMPVYQDAETLQRVLSELFDRVIADPEGLKELSSKKMVFVFDVIEPAMLVTVNGRSKPPTWSLGRAAGHVSLGIRTRMDILHQLLLKEMRVRDAFTGQKVQVDGSILSALRLEGLFHVLQKHYPAVLRDLGIGAGENESGAARA
jgi:hypothetical protein